jgi:20S proteasome alpha/beta subunit
MNPTWRKRYPWWRPVPQNMTLCIAALADGYQDDPKIVLCSDMLLGNEYQSIETEAKSDVGFSDTLAALYAGTYEDSTNLKRVLLRTVRAKELTLDNYIGVLSDGWNEFDAIPRALPNSKSDAQCIVAGFIEGEPRIIRIEKEGVDTLPFCVAIGIGGYHADTVLSWRQITQYSSLEQVLYCLYEAKRFGRLCKDVGSGTIMEILRLDKQGEMQVDLVMHQGLNEMGRWFERFGPKDLAYDLTLPLEALHRIKPD